MYKWMNKCIFVTCILVLYDRFTALSVISLNVFPFFLWHVKPYQMLLMDKHESKPCWNKSSWMTIRMKGHELTGSTHSNFFLSCISCSLQTYSRDVSWKCCLITSTDTSAWKTDRILKKGWRKQGTEIIRAGYWHKFHNSIRFWFTSLQFESISIPIRFNIDYFEYQLQ